LDIHFETKYFEIPKEVEIILKQVLVYIYLPFKYLLFILLIIISAKITEFGKEFNRQINRIENSNEIRLIDMTTITLS